MHYIFIFIYMKKGPQTWYLVVDKYDAGIFYMKHAYKYVFFSGW